MRTVAGQYLDNRPPRRKKDFRRFRKYLEEVWALLIYAEEERSLYITVKCTSLEILEDLWRAYKSGELNEVAERYLITDELLKEYELREFTFITVIDEAEYRRCKEELTQFEGNLMVASSIREVGRPETQRGGCCPPQPCMAKISNVVGLGIYP